MVREAHPVYTGKEPLERTDSQEVGAAADTVLLHLGFTPPIVMEKSWKGDRR
jgi:hypothetical protein